jgi:pimeloyl-ACP methyl ester carboxylesterase
MILALAEADRRQELTELRLPPLLVWGAQDVRSPLTGAQDLHAQIEGSRLVVFDDAAHLAQVEAAERLNPSTTTFCPVQSCSAWSGLVRSWLQR